MPFVPWDNNALRDVDNRPLEVASPEPKSTALDQIGAAFSLENDITNAMEYLGREKHDPDPSFDLFAHMKQVMPERVERGEDLDIFVRARSRAQFEQITAQEEKEQGQRKTLQEAGKAGIAYGIMAGVLSPTTFIPLVGVTAKGAQAVRQGAVIGGGTMLAQEAVLHQNQVTRTAEESGIAVGAGVVLGGVLGGAVGLARKGSVTKLEKKFANDVDESTPDDLVYIQAPSALGGENSVGAAAARVTPDGTAGILDSSIKFGKGKLALERLGPVTRQLNSPLRSARWAMAQISHAGLKLSGVPTGRVVTDGGTIEARVAKYRGNLMEGLKALDSAYVKHVYQDRAPKFAAATRAAVRGLASSGKLSQTEFYEQVSRAVRAGENAELEGFAPEVLEAARAMNSQVFEPLLKEMQGLKMLPEEVKTLGDMGYLNRVYNVEAIKADEKGFLDLLARHYEQLQLEDFNKRAEKVLDLEATAKQALDDLSLSPEDAEALGAQLERELAEAAAADNPLLDVLDEIASLKIDAKEAAGTELEKELLDRVKELRKAAGPELKKYERGQRKVAKRLRGLNKTIASLNSARRAKMERIFNLERQQVMALDRVARKYVKLKKDFDKLDDVALEREVSRMKNLFADALGSLDRSDEKLSKIYNDENGDIGKLLGQDAIVQTKTAKLTNIADQLGEVEDVAASRDELLDLLDRMYIETLQTTRDLNAKKVMRTERLKTQIDALDPKRAVAAAEAKVTKAGELKAALEERLRLQEVDEVSLEPGNVSASFREASMMLAQETTAKIKGGTRARIVGFDLIRGERGPELQRMLSIPSKDIEAYLENNIEKLIRGYVRTVSPDIELTRRFGSVNGASAFEDIQQEFEVLIQAAESADAKKAIVKATKEELKAAKQAGDAPTVARLEDRLESLKESLTSKQLNDAREEAINDLAAVVGRLRHEWGVPADPSSFGARAARVAMNINTLRFMGMVAVSSIPDTARAIQKYGPGRFYESGLKALVTNFKSLKLNLKEAQLAGTALDVFLHTRMYEMMEMVDDFGKRGPLEQGLEFATSKIGVLGGFDYWNTYMKGFGSMLFNAEALDSIAVLAKPGHKGAKSVKQAQDFLARMQLDGATAGDIWRLVEAGGGGEVKPGVWLPNTEDWSAAAEKIGMPVARAEQVKRTYQAALVNEVDSIIVTPGVERPLVMDGSLTGKLLFQFRSFALSSTFKTLMAGMQERNANFMIGSAAAMGMGALSYKLWGVASGNDTSEQGYDKWADEMVDRSGILGIFGEVRNVGSTIPWLNDYVMFSGEQTTRRGGSGAANAILGPSGDLLFTTAGALSDIDDPTKGTVQKLRKLMPYQNLWWARQAIYDNLVEGIDLPEQRQ